MQWADRWYDGRREPSPDASQAPRQKLSSPGDKLCAVHLQARSFRRAKLFEDYELNRRPFKRREGVYFSRNFTFLELANDLQFRVERDELNNHGILFHTAWEAANRAQGSNISCSRRYENVCYKISDNGCYLFPVYHCLNGRGRLHWRSQPSGHKKTYYKDRAYRDSVNHNLIFGLFVFTVFWI
jgi:hypothetical protein